MKTYLWTFLPAAGTSEKNWPIRDKEGKHLKSVTTILKCSIAGRSFCQEDVSFGLFEKKKKKKNLNDDKDSNDESIWWLSFLKKKKKKKKNSRIITKYRAIK